MFQCDEARPFCSEEAKLYLERKGIKLQAATGEAHARLGIIERRRMVLRTAIETYTADAHLERSLKPIREAARHVARVANTVSFTRGYTPS